MSSQALYEQHKRSETFDLINGRQWQAHPMTGCNRSMTRCYSPRLPRCLASPRRPSSMMASHDTAQLTQLNHVLVTRRAAESLTSLSIAKQTAFRDHGVTDSQSLSVLRRKQSVLMHTRCPCDAHRDTILHYHCMFCSTVSSPLPPCCYSQLKW